MVFSATGLNRAVFWFETACALASIACVAVGVRIGSAKGQLTVDEQRVLADRSDGGVIHEIDGVMART